jgi:hypothetical protein
LIKIIKGREQGTGLAWYRIRSEVGWVGWNILALSGF